MAAYADLEQMGPGDYLWPSRFVTEHDHQGAQEKARSYAKSQYDKGIKYGKEGDVVINPRSVWRVEIHPSGLLSSSEGIGYHRSTADLLAGFLDSGARVFVERYRKKGGFTKPIQIAGPGTPKKYVKERARALVESGDFKRMLLAPPDVQVAADALQIGAKSNPKEAVPVWYNFSNNDVGLLNEASELWATDERDALRQLNRRYQGHKLRQIRRKDVDLFWD